jgi:hypothetical protein
VRGPRYHARVSSSRQLVRVRGHVAAKRVRLGTAGEHDALVLTTPAGQQWTLIELGGNPFEPPRGAAPPGAEVEVEGFVVGSELRFRNLRRLDG